MAMNPYLAGTFVTVIGMPRRTSVAPVDLSRPVVWRTPSIYYGGTGRIVGTVKEKASPANLPLERRLRLYRDRDGRFVSETWSDATGAYVFSQIDLNERYTVIGWDHQHNYRAVVADNLAPEVMP